jgi:hypothetical protein
MNTTVWHSTSEFAEFIVSNTLLRQRNPKLRPLYESDASKPRNFHAMPDHLKKILYLDAPDLIVEVNSEPIFSIEVSTEAGTGHNAFQRFARLAASVENLVPAFYIYPEASIVSREGGRSVKWDKINPLIFRALDRVMAIHGIPALLHYFPACRNHHPRNRLAAGIAREVGRTVPMHWVGWAR